MNFQEFPKVMKHPGHTKAVIYKQPRLRPGDPDFGKPVNPADTGRPERLADVMVNNPDQEQQYAALGYVPAGVSDPEAYRRAKTNNLLRPESNFHEYPKIVYRAKNAEECEERLVNSKAEESALGEGWFRNPGEAQARRKAKPELKAETAKADKPKSKHKMSAATRAKISASLRRRAQEKAQAV